MTSRLLQIGLACLLFAAPVLAQGTIRIETPLVNLNVRVMDGAGRNMVDLTAVDFQIYEDGVRQELTHFTPVDAPVGLLLLMDFSFSAQNKRKMMKQAAVRFIDSLSPVDRIAIATFTTELNLGASFTTDRKQLKKVAGKFKDHPSGTKFYDSMWQALDLFKPLSGRKAIVVLTDGSDNNLLDPEEFPVKHSFYELLERIAEEDVTIYPLYFDTEYEMVDLGKGRETRETFVIARRQLNEIAEQTGGTMFRVNRIEDLKGVYERVAAELRALYSIAFSPEKPRHDGSFRKVAVKISRNGARVKTRRGYYDK
jgi:Ca-activated chloride channel family protein